MQVFWKKCKAEKLIKHLFHNHSSFAIETAFSAVLDDFLDHYFRLFIFISEFCIFHLQLMTLPPIQKLMTTRVEPYNSPSMFLRIFRCQPAEQGSNRRRVQDLSYGAFVNDVREVFGKKLVIRKFIHHLPAIVSCSPHQNLYTICQL